MQCDFQDGTLEQETKLIEKLVKSKYSLVFN